MRFFCFLWFAFSFSSFGQTIPPAATPVPAPQTSEPTPDETKPVHIGGAVKPPGVLRSVAPVISPEDRKVKFTGNVVVYCWVDEQGNPSHVRVVRGVGRGLDEKAVEAVQQYKFKPAMKNGKPVKVDLYIDINFQTY